MGVRVAAAALTALLLLSCCGGAALASATEPVTIAIGVAATVEADRYAAVVFTWQQRFNCSMTVRVTPSSPAAGSGLQYACQLCADPVDAGGSCTTALAAVSLSDPSTSTALDITAFNTGANWRAAPLSYYLRVVATAISDGAAARYTVGVTYASPSCEGVATSSTSATPRGSPVGSSAAYGAAAGSGGGGGGGF